jgi:hypothetical protein
MNRPKVEKGHRQGGKLESAVLEATIAEDELWTRNSGSRMSVQKCA